MKRLALLRLGIPGGLTLSQRLRFMFPESRVYPACRTRGNRGLVVYSDLKAFMGSTLVARRAGRTAASRAVASIKRATSE